MGSVRVIDVFLAGTRAAREEFAVGAYRALASAGTAEAMPGEPRSKNHGGNAKSEHRKGKQEDLQHNSSTFRARRAL
jgi:hypothetical protein